MRASLPLTAISLVIALVPAAPAVALVPPGRSPMPLAHTYSIVARDSVTGELGVAVQSHYFSVGPIVPWVEAGVGAVATQSLVLVDYGPRGLDLMRAGLTAQQALDSLLRADPHRDGRQVAMVDAHGGVAAWTGRGGAQRVQLLGADLGRPAAEAPVAGLEGLRDHEGR